MENTTVKAFRMQLKPGFEKEYKKRHDEIWPELSELLKNAGVLEYYIFLDERTLALFAFQKLRENDTTSVLAALPIMKKWWDFMADIMDVNIDNSPQAFSLPEVFRL
ncbi:L-rhamnose mutarotase [Dyadobacter aurulentus]|uniref:L-rhamnose mutarotase n=1 Tax=Dyadobacter sp. UC 10 TaxID=2605428 RepID=UPI0011F1B62B|nr:L-rhamnose mutarotase [Dyadobacter sp. UC 10]KAA0990313.1 L-rhamnose mutarotase [Dyadobacter sp. UC 10]